MPDIKTLLRQAAKPTLSLLTFIMICAFLARYLTGAETLLDYARENPELAYGEKDPKGKASQGATASENALTEQVKTPVSQMTSVSENEKSSENRDISATSDAPSAYTESEADSKQPDSLSKKQEEEDAMTEQIDHPDRTVYQEGFYYEPLTDTVKQRITGISYPTEGCTVPYEDLNYVGLLYVDFNGQEQIGELICNKAVAQDMVEIFYELYQNDYRLERVRLVDEYGGDDTASMADNNTSCFNYRVVDGTTNLSKHAYGLAIDVNPYYNPYVVFRRNPDGSDYISPPGSEAYADRSQSFAYKIDENDLCYRLFAERGFTWGGNWNSTKDYQHFQKKLK